MTSKKNTIKVNKNYFNSLKNKYINNPYNYDSDDEEPILKY